MSEEVVSALFKDVIGSPNPAQFRAAFLALSENRRVGITVIVLMIISSSARTGWLLYADRLATTQRLAGVDESTREALASSGWFANESGLLICFCCEAEAGLASQQQHRPDCLAARLVSLASAPSTSAEWPSAADSAVRLHLPSTRRLRLLLDSPVVGAAASYGFDPAFLQVCLARQFLRSAASTASGGGSSGIERPGDLLRLAQSVEDADPRAPAVAARFDLRRLIDSCLIDPAAGGSETSASHDGSAGRGGGGSSVDAYAVPSFAASSVSAIVGFGGGGGPANTDLSDPAGESEVDDRCIRCRNRTRNRVTLPCAHFLLCDRCLEPLTRCPKCNASIAAAVTAFIT
ncbi:hypothetical protein BOX15_Mlig023860g2 [Macrostomum lignano]|uniref:RING-type domain-containing protein n=2 Tax=Macrostomum lignano TaxID=282301 RepID=A0A267FZF3_9PLAT|nr:hypothetical protein BOX15_Mlig023860g2 [Macrostomum lignano]